MPSITHPFCLNFPICSFCSSVVIYPFRDIYLTPCPSCRSIITMSVSNDPENFFQTTASLETLNKRRLKSSNKNGNPLVLPSKIVTFCLEPIPVRTGLPRLFTGESGGLARRVNLEVSYAIAQLISRQEILHILFVGIKGLLHLLWSMATVCSLGPGTRRLKFGMLRYTCLQCC